MNIIAYVKTGCSWCIAATDFLKINATPFEERNVTENEVYMQEMLEKSGQAKAPTFDIDGHIIPDGGKDEIEAYLKEQGVL